MGEAVRETQEAVGEKTGEAKAGESPLSVFGVPYLGYLPETGIQLGAAGALYYRPKGRPDARTSSLSSLLMITTREQFIVHFFPQWYFDEDNYVVDADLSYIKDADYFWGLGNDSPESAQETYTTIGPRVKAGLLRRLPPFIFFGLRAHAEQVDMTQRDAGGLIETAPGIVGRNGTTLTGVGFEFTYDDRDSNLSAEKGTLITFTPMTYSRALGGTQSFVSYTLDARKFFELAPKHVLSLELYASAVAGDVPFVMLPRLGGPTRMRGIYEGRFRDRVYVMSQAEYRFPIFWRFGGAAFVGTGRVARGIGDLGLDGLKLAGGLGLRFTISEEKRAVIRLDAGASPNVPYPAFYATINEAF